MRRSPCPLLVAAALGAALAVLLPGGRLEAQVVVERVGEGEPPHDRRLDLLLRSRDYLLITRDTLIAAGERVERSVLVLDATLTLEGTIAGDLVGVDADLFLRPTAVIEGDVVNLAGGLYRSALAAEGGVVVNSPLAPYRVVRVDGTFRIESTVKHARLELDGISGFRVPTYDRVDALGLSWGGSYLLWARSGLEQRLRGWAGYATGRGEPLGRIELDLLGRQTSLLLGAERLTDTNDRWIRGDLSNSGIFLLRGRDYRNYYEADRLYARLRRTFERGAWSGEAALAGQFEEARSLGAGDPWTLFEDDERLNPPIDNGRITSLAASAQGEWASPTALVGGGLSLEAAASEFASDFGFFSYTAWGAWAMQALSDHTLRVAWRFQGPLPGTASLPRQRWTFVGGSRTLYTFPMGRFRGDRLAFVRSDYVIPLPERLRLPLIGAPDLELIHIAAMAWTEEEHRDLEQNLGVELRFFGPYVRLITDPADPDHLELGVGLGWPFGRAYPWQRGRSGAP